ncbi:MAG TPA: N-formylglutamate amidohydrolase [Usitatibacter sp.]|nr:N-formylglutamate amidohydrolase [Usitatibacter sp.]
MFTLTEPRRGHVPLVLDSPHSGTEYPQDFRFALPKEALRQAEDSYVDQLYAAGPDVGATLIAARFPRSYIDPNRSVLDIDASLLDAPWPGPAVPSPKTARGIGLIWRVLDTGEPIYARKLGVEEVKQRIVRYHQPYQRAVKDALDSAYRHFGAVWHLNLHSMPAVSSTVSEEGPGKSRADFVLGDRDGTTCEPEFTALVGDTLRAMGYEVKVNDPYKGVELVRAFSDPKAGRHSLQIEVNRRLYMDERTRERSAGFEPLAANLTRMLEAVAAYAAERGSHACEHHDHPHDHDHHGHAHHGHDHDHKHEHDHAHEHSHGRKGHSHEH